MDGHDVHFFGLNSTVSFILHMINPLYNDILYEPRQCFVKRDLISAFTSYISTLELQLKLNFQLNIQQIVHLWCNYRLHQKKEFFM